jgi:hypothetical protein
MATIHDYAAAGLAQSSPATEQPWPDPLDDAAFHGLAGDGPNRLFVPSRFYFGAEYAWC